MKILYISNSIIPSRTANSIHVMKMCQAFADNGHKVILLAPDNKKHYEREVSDVFKFYGVRQNFVIKKLWYSSLKGSFFYTISILFYLIFNKNKNFDLVYGRYLHGCYIASLFLYNIVFEAHAPMYEEKLFSRKIFNFLTKSKYFKKLIVISNSLKNMYLENGYLSDKLIKVAHELNISPRMLSAVDSKNNDVRKNKDWESMEGRAVINISENASDVASTNPLDYLPPHDYQLDN